MNMDHASNEANGSAQSRAAGCVLRHYNDRCGVPARRRFDR